MILKKIHIIFSLMMIIAIALIIYLPSFSSYFFQDDWYSLIISRVGNFAGAVNFFLPNKNVVYFRPLGMQFPFMLNTALFGLNPLPLHIFTFIIHILNVVLVYLLFMRLLKDNFSALLSSFLYAVSGIHYIPFFWSATFAFVLGPFFTLLTFIFFLDRKYLISLIFFTLGLLTYEMITVFPLSLLMYGLLFRTKINFAKLLPFFILASFYLLFRLLYFPPPDIPDYKFSLGLQTLHNIKYYFLWSFNWPEEIKNQFISFFSLNREFVSGFKIYYLSFVVSLMINILLLFLFPAFFIFLRLIKLDYRAVTFSVFWVFSSILPVIFFPLHTFPYYLPFSFIALLYLLIPLFKKSVAAVSPKFKYAFFICTAILIVNWVTSAQQLVDFNSKVHWAPRRSILSQNFVKDAQKINIIPGKNPIFLIKADDENRFALNDQDALRVLFNNPQIVTIYTNENMNGIRL